MVPIFGGFFCYNERMVKGVRAGETPNEFYPKVIFRESGLIELLSEGTAILVGEDFIVEPTEDWPSGHMLYQGLDGGKLVYTEETP